VFAGGSFFQWFPSRGLTSGSWQELPSFLRSMYPEGMRLGNPANWLPWYWRVFDYFWHLVLPLTAMALGAFTTMSFLTKNAFLDEIRKQYVITARAKGLAERDVLYGHVFRNAMLLIIAGFPGAFIHAFFSGSLLIETIFSLDGLGLLSFESVINRDYAVVFATLYIFSLLGLFVNLVSDFVYTMVDPRIDFESREV
jgi:microcin C transport system permease protein